MAKQLKVQLVVQLFQHTSVEQAAEWLRWMDEGAVKPTAAWRRKVKLFGDGLGRSYSNPTQKLSITRTVRKKTVKITHPAWRWIKNLAMEMIKSFLDAQEQLAELRDNIVDYFTMNMTAIRDETFVAAIRDKLDPFDFYDPYVSKQNKFKGPFSPYTGETRSTRRRRGVPVPTEPIPVPFAVEQLDEAFLSRTVKTGVLVEEGGEWPLCSGCTVDPDGWVLTNAHCVQNDNEPEEITEVNMTSLMERGKPASTKPYLGILKVMIYHSGRWAVTECVHIDPVYDFALMKPLWLSGAGPLDYTELTRAAVEGEPVVVVGNPSPEGGVTYPPIQHSAPGIVVALKPLERNNREELERRYEEDEPYNSTLAHTCYTFGGNSGSPLFSAEGELVGLHNAWWAVGKLNPARAGVDMRYIQNALRVLPQLPNLRTPLPPLWCEVCEKPATLACPCRTEFYCGEQCSEQAWTEHSDVCPRQTLD